MPLHVTSPGAGEGKSAVAAGLKRLLGQDVREGEGSPRVVVAAYRGERTAERLKAVTGAVGVILNMVPIAQNRYVERELKPAVEASGLRVLGQLPEDRSLRGSAVSGLAEYLHANVVAGNDFLDNEFQSVMIGAMSHQHATTLPYFQRMDKKIVVTGGDRIDIHMGALGTPTAALVLTGGYHPDPVVVERAEAENVPILEVLPETPDTLEQIGRFLNQLRFVDSNAGVVADLLRQHVDLEPIRAALGEAAAAGSR